MHELFEQEEQQARVILEQGDDTNDNGAGDVNDTDGVEHCNATSKTSTPALKIFPTATVKTATAGTKSKKNRYACKKDDKYLINLRNSHDELLKSYAEIDKKTSPETTRVNKFKHV